MWKDINDGKIEQVFVWALDRLLRTVSSTAVRFIEDARENEVRITSVKERELMGEDSAGEFMLHMYLSLARQESQRKS